MNNDQTIPAEKVRELADKYDKDSSGNPERLLVQAIADLRALLPVQQPTTGLLGRWAKHDAYGDVVVISDRTDNQGDVWVSYIADSEPDGMDCNQVRIDSLTFPEQATKPEDVPAGEAWLVDVNATHVKAEKATGFRHEDGEWFIVHMEGECEITWDDCYDNHVTLVCPLTPERPVSDLQVKYDALEERWKRLDDLYRVRGRDRDELYSKCREAQERIKALEQKFLLDLESVPEDAEALVDFVRRQKERAILNGMRNTALAYRNIECVLRNREQTKQPAWRIEHDHKSLRVGEYIIDYVDDGGTVEKIDETGTRRTDAGALGKPQFAPFIVFPNKGAATPEAIEEAKRARDKEMEE